jgi:hypothetical protein
VGFDQGAQKYERARKRHAPRRVTFRPSPSREPHPQQELTVRDQEPEVPDQGIGVARRHEEALAAVFDDLVRSPGSGGDHGQPEPHRFEVGDAQGLVVRGDDQ